MRIKKNNSSKKKLSFILVTTLIILCGIAMFVFVRTNSPSSNQKPVKTGDSDDQQVRDLQSNPEGKKENSNSDKPAAPTTNATSGKKQVTVTASTNMSGGTVYIRGGINYPVMGGACYAQLSGPSDQSIRKDTTILQNPASTDCKTISIPTSELASGKWTFTLHYTSDDYEGVSNEISFTI